MSVDRTTTFWSKPCPLCNERTELTVPTVAYLLWQSGAFVQDAFPDWSPDQREMLITGFHPECWVELFGEDEDEPEIEEAVA